MVKHTDEYLIRQIVNGDRQLFSVLYGRYKSSLFTVCLRYFSNRAQAEDVFQEGMIKIFTKLKYFDPNKGAFYTWSQSILSRLCIDALRAERRMLPLEELEPVVEDNSETLEATDAMSLEELVALINELPKGYRLVFNMYVLDGFTHAEIAKVLDISINTSKSQLFKARKMLKKKFNNAENMARVS